MSRFHYKSIAGRYEVWLDGVLIGTVEKWERRYNLRRIYVSRGWRAITAKGERLYGDYGATADTREAAAEELATNRKPTGD